MIYILVVLYKKNLAESETLLGLLNAATTLQKMKACVHVWDNSPVESLTVAEKELLHNTFDFNYTHCPENRPLSYVYNIAIEQVTKNNVHDYLVLLDHDSKIGEPYFKELSEIIAFSKKPDVILPVAKFNNKLISPAKLFLVRG